MENKPIKKRGDLVAYYSGIEIIEKRVGFNVKVKKEEKYEVTEDYYGGDFIKCRPIGNTTNGVKIRKEYIIFNK